MTASSRSWLPLVIPTLVVRTLTTVSSTTFVQALQEEDQYRRFQEPQGYGQVEEEVEKAKRTLSSQQSTRIEIESFEEGNDFSETLTRAKFES